MGLIPCPVCKKQVSEQAPTCLNCGHPIAGQSQASQGQLGSGVVCYDCGCLIPVGSVHRRDVYSGSSVSVEPAPFKPFRLPKPPKVQRQRHFERVNLCPECNSNRKRKDMIGCGMIIVIGGASLATCAILFA